MQHEKEGEQTKPTKVVVRTLQVAGLTTLLITTFNLQNCHYSTKIDINKLDITTLPEIIAP